LTPTVPPPQPGDRVLHAVAHALRPLPPLARTALTAALVAADHPNLTPAEAARVAADPIDERAIAAAERADALLAETTPTRAGAPRRLDNPLVIGETANITLHDTTVVEVRGDRFVVDLQGHLIGIPRRTGAVSVDRLVPADGTPQPGDIWRDGRGFRWHAVRVAGRALRGLYLVGASSDGELTRWEDVNKARGPLVLEYRPAPVAEGVGE